MVERVFFAEGKCRVFVVQGCMLLSALDNKTSAVERNRNEIFVMQVEQYEVVVDHMLLTLLGNVASLDYCHLNK